MRRAIKVFLGDEPRLVGLIRYDAAGVRESAAFEYDPAWLVAPDRFALEPGLPLVGGAQFHKKDHLLNQGFLHRSRGQWRLAPAFDLNPFPERARELKTWISEDAGPEATIEGLMSVAPYFRVSKARAKEILREVDHAVATWREEGASLGMTDTELDQFADAFEHSEREAAQRA